MSRLPGFGCASLLALVEGPFFSEQTCCGEGRGFSSKCAKCSLQRRAVVKGQPIRGLSETRGTAAKSGGVQSVPSERRLGPFDLSFKLAPFRRHASSYVDPCPPATLSWPASGRCYNTPPSLSRQAEGPRLQREGVLFFVSCRQHWGEGHFRLVGRFTP